MFNPSTATASRELTADDSAIVIADFEGSSYGDWKVSGEAFGNGPANGTLPGQMAVEGFQGKGLVNSFRNGDDSVGRLTSPSFKIKRKFITFLIGGGGWADELALQLIVDGKVVRAASGSNTTSGGSERLNPLAWDVSDLIDREAIINIIDDRRGGWGHINVDHIVQTNERGSTPIALPPIPMQKDVQVEITVNQKLMHFPVKNGGKPRIVTIQSEGKEIRRFDIELADDTPDWWAPLDMSEWMGKKVRVTANVLPEGSKALSAIQQSEKLLGAEDLYKEPLRSQFHFSPKRGWTNDPNGLVYFGGEYHLFFQHNPYGWNWGNMHWGHATSKDLVHWTEHGEALYPDAFGPMFSGSAVVDWKNTSKFGKDSQPPLVLIYTAAGNPTVQCIAYSLDGRKFEKYSNNPVVKQISGGNRDPKVFWHEPTKKWIMVLYVEIEGKKHSIHFFTSSNMREWELASITEGGIDGDKYLFECPDMFELPIDGDATKKRWVLNAANSEYAIGTFDGTTFKPEVSRLPDVRGVGFYAAQTFSDLPDGRRIQIGWLQAPSPGMSFNQLQSLPYELTLKSTKDGPRLHRAPAKELLSLRNGSNQSSNIANFRSELVELRTEFAPASASSVAFNVRGAKIVYDAEKQELSVNGHISPAPLVNGTQKLVIYVDKTMIEVLASDGAIYVPVPFIAKDADQSVTIEQTDGKIEQKSLELYSLKSIWR